MFWVLLKCFNSSKQRRGEICMDNSRNSEVSFSFTFAYTVFMGVTFHQASVSQMPPLYDKKAQRKKHVLKVLKLWFVERDLLYVCDESQCGKDMFWIVLELVFFPNHLYTTKCNKCPLFLNGFGIVGTLVCACVCVNMYMNMYMGIFVFLHYVYVYECVHKSQQKVNQSSHPPTPLHAKD